MGRREIRIAWFGLVLVVISGVLLAWTMSAPDEAPRPKLAPRAVTLVPSPPEVLSHVGLTDDDEGLDTTSMATGRRFRIVAHRRL